MSKATNQIYNNNDTVLHNGQNTGTFISLKDDTISLVSKKEKGIYIDERGVFMQGQIVNNGLTMDEKNGMIQQESLTKETFIPSSMVTPLPDKFPWLQRINKITKIFKQLSKL